MKALSVSQIGLLCKKYNINLNGYYNRDNVKLNNMGWYMLNLDRSDGKGTHWCTFYYSPHLKLYFDSFGFQPPELLEELFQHNYYYNTSKIQSLKSSSCGWFCLLCIKYCEENGNTLQAFQQFLQLFKRPEYNEQLLNEYFK